MARFIQRLGLIVALTAAYIGSAVYAHGQGVGIGTSAPDASAALDVSASEKGALMPRLTAAQRAAIVSPATGLLVYQTTDPAGFYYNSGSPAAPTWTYLVPDNLGNHQATQTLNLRGFALTGTGASIGSTVGIGVRADGGLNIGQSPASNVFIGYRSGEQTTTGTTNTFVGVRSGNSNTTGLDNTFVGFLSGNENTTGISNTFIGRNSGQRNTAGANNTFTGSASGQANSTGANNTFTGGLSGQATTTGHDNTFIGALSGHGNISGSGNTYVGTTTAFGITDGNNNWALGYRAGPSTAGLSNAGALGYNAQVSQSNSLALGGTGTFAIKVGIGTPTPRATLHVIGNIYATGAITQSSDLRYKTHVQPIRGALAAAMQLQGVRYRWRAAEFPQHRFPAAPQVGFIAQDVERVVPELVQTDVAGFKSVDYARLTPLLVEALKEQQHLIDALKHQTAALETQLQATQATLMSLGLQVAQMRQTDAAPAQALK